MSEGGTFMKKRDQLRDSQRELRLLSDATDAGIAIAERELIIDSNVSLARMLGCEIGDLVGKNLTELMSEETYRTLQSRLRDGIDEPYQGVGVRLDGTTFPAQVKGVDYEFDGKRIVVVAFGDLSKLKDAEEKLRQSEQRYQLLFNSMLDGFVLHEVTCDESGAPVGCRITEANPAFSRVTGIATDEIVGRSMAQRRAGIEPNWLELYSNVIAAGEPVRIERFFAERDRFLEIVAFSHREGEMATVLSDVTERKKLETRLRQAAKMEAIGTLASGVAHEINNPINIIMNYAGLILRPDVAREDVETFAKEIVNESERIATIVRNLLAFARQEQEMPSPATISGIVESTLSLMKKVLDNDQITVVVEVPDDLPQIQCRRQQIEQVLVNLLTNARHALNERYPNYDESKRLTIRALTFEREGRQWIRTEIEDQGPGIPPDVIDRIFDPFFTTKSGGSGTGLGLSVSHGIVDDHSGRLTVRSQLGHYTRFIVELPVYDPDADWPRFERRPIEGGPVLF